MTRVIDWSRETANLMELHASWNVKFCDSTYSVACPELLSKIYEKLCKQMLSTVFGG